MSTARYALTGTGGAAPNQTALAAGGYSTSSSGMANTEEWSFPSGPSFLIEGDMWYNSTTAELKVYGKAAGVPSATWASGGNLNTARHGTQGFGTQSAALLGGGLPVPANGILTELYNGSAWTEVAEQNTAKGYRTSTGTSQTAGLLIGGEPSTDAVEEWNGTSWTEVNEVNTATYKAGASGSTTAALKFGGTDPRIANTESYDGTSWTEVSDLNNDTRDINPAGSQTAALCIGGNISTGTTAEVEVWDGSSWTETTDINTARELGQTGNGTMSSTFALLAGGNPGAKANTEFWNGTAWTELADLAKGRNAGGGAGSASVAIVMGGYNPSPGALNTTEEWTASATVSTVTTS